MTVLITARGISEPMRGNMLTQLVNQFPQWDHIELPWKAEYGPVNAKGNPAGVSYRAALQGGLHLLDLAVAERVGLDPSERIVLAGYSGGTALVGDWLASRWFHFRQVQGAVLVADPAAPGDDEGWGVAGRRNITRFGPVLWVTNPRDIICHAPADSPVRTIADQSAAMSLADPKGWGLDLIDRLNTGRWQAIRSRPWDVVGLVRRYQVAVDGVAGYLGVGRMCEHTVYNHQRLRNGNTWLQQAAHDLREAL